MILTNNYDKEGCEVLRQEGDPVHYGEGILDRPGSLK